MTPRAKRAVVLLSGGIDSATALAVAQRAGFEVYALTIDYGQRHDIELESARAVARQAAVKKHVILKLDLRTFGGSALTAPLKVPAHDQYSDSAIPTTYVPARNTIFLSLALAWCEVLGAQDVFLGANSDDATGYPDCRPRFIEAFEQLGDLATREGVEGRQHLKVHTPVGTLTKAETVEIARQIGVPLELTWSCYAPNSESQPCGRCDACALRHQAFDACGVGDPAAQSNATPIVATPYAADWWRNRLVVVTGAGGFIGAELTASLLEAGARVVGLDRNWDRSDPLRRERLNRCAQHPGFTHIEVDLCDHQALATAFRGLNDAVVFHLAARPGVRHPSALETYSDNVIATERLLNVLREVQPSQLVFASSSSVYGRDAALPFTEAETVGEATSDYARSKQLNERSVDEFHRATGTPTTVARLFNVYGPRGRPDTAISIFTRRLIQRQRLDLAAGGAIERDFTFVDDVVEALARLAMSADKDGGARTLNVGTGARVTIRHLVRMLEELIAPAVSIDESPRHPLDLQATQANLTELRGALGWVPGTPLGQGLARVVAWARTQRPARSEIEAWGQGSSLR